MSKPISILLFGAGNRGADAYGPYALRHPDQVQFTAVAEPDPGRRARFAAAAKAGFDYAKRPKEHHRYAD